MSLQLAAQHMASRGRGPDTTLVHMAPQEVAGLQALAKAHGGSLTTNPDTGLPEAGFLSSILPTVIGAGLSIASGGTLTPLMAAGITGAGYGVATGSLKKGLMAGLGAYGGAGLAGGLMSAGATAALPETGLTAMGGVAGANPMIAQPTMTFGAGPDPTSVLGAGPYTGSTIPSSYVTNPEALANNAYSVGPSTAKLTAGVPQVATTTPMTDRFSQAFQGAKNLSTPEGRELFMGNAASKGVEAKGVGGMKGLMQYGLMGLGPAALEMMTPEQRAVEEKAKLQPKNYNFAYNQRANPNVGYIGAQTGERLHFDPIYTPITAAGGGLMDIGPVESMSRSNQSQMAPAYAQGGVSDMAVNPYTGAEMFAEGDNTKAVRPVEEDPYYTMSGQSGDAYKYLMGQMLASPKAPAPAYVAPAPVAAAPAAAPAPTPAQSTVRPVIAALNPLRGSAFANVFQTPSPEAQAAGGEWVDDTSGNVKPYIFDPTTGTFTAAPVPKVWRPYEVEVAPTMDYGSFTGGGYAQGGIASLARGGQSHLGDYSDGGRLLKGPGDGVSDSIPATIANKRPARLADGEFVVPARIVSELGNGSTEAGARKLYAMMDRVQKARKKSIGKNRVAVNSRAEKLLPA